MSVYKTGSEVEIHIYQLLKASNIRTEISGDIYRADKRPKNSTLEDAIVIFTAGLPRQIQTGVVTVLIYVPDLDIGGGVLVENGVRTLAVEKWAANWCSNLNLNSEYYFTLENTIVTRAEPEIKQHFISTRLNYKLLTLT